MPFEVTLLLGIVIGLAVGAGAFAIASRIRRNIRVKNGKEKITDAEQEAKQILDNAAKDAENKKRDMILGAKEEILQLRNDAERELKDRRAEVTKQERRLMQKEETIDRKTEALEKKNDQLDEKLKTDTNTLVSISSGDREMRALAAQINTELKSLRKERLRLRHGDMELKSAVTNISHDLRTPLTAICGYLDLMEQEQLSDNAKRYLSVIRERTDAMRTLTEELFRYSVITSADEEMHFEPVILGDILEQSLAGFYGTLKGNGIVPKIEIPERQIVLELDKTALRRVFDNILSNAAKYSDGDLNVTLTEDGSAVFENSAKELDSVLTARLFDRFFTVNDARGGTGLGLSIAKQLSEKMNGSITAEYSSGKLTVRVSFPE